MKAIYDHRQTDWQNLKILARNRLPTRPFYCGWGSAEAALSGRKEDSPYFRSLNGDWLFRYFASPFDVPEGLTAWEAPEDGFSPIPVPSHWQFHGYGSPHYTDAISLIPTHFPPIVQSENPTGVYRKWVDLERDPSLEYILRFDGVESAFHLWINGKEAGYSQGSRNTAEFDVTAMLQSGRNLIAAVVYQYCDGSMIECQDMWTLGGIMRDVSLLTRPRVHLADMTVQGDLTPDYENGVLRVELRPANHTECDTEIRVECRLLQAQEIVLTTTKTLLLPADSEERMLFCEEIPAPRKWTAETPHLYDLLIILQCAGKQEIYSQQVGFRKVELKDGLILLNGQYITFRGMNRHDWSCDNGRCVTEEEMRTDLFLMKQANINAVRSAHYPNQQVFYRLCDQLGFYVVAEADLECNQTEFRADPHCISDSPQWTAAYLDRVQRMVERDKNFTSILIWSLGNESGYGKNFVAAAAYCRQADPTRLLHYEEDREAESVDMYTSMYTKHADLEQFGKRAELKKPHLLIEYAHVLGNSPGGLAEYWEIIDRYPRLQGGFIWEWIAHGIRWKDDEGKTYFRYGGDFGDTPNSGKFCTSGILAPDRKPYPALWHLAQALCPIKVMGDLAVSSCTVKNDHSFLSLDSFSLTARVMSEGKVLDEFEVDISNIPPLSQKRLPLSGLKATYTSAHPEVFVNLRCTMRETPVWAPRSPWNVGEWQFPLPAERIRIAPDSGSEPGNIEIQSCREGRFLQVDCGNSRYTFDLAKGTLCGLDRSGKPLLTREMDTCFWRAPLDNDRWQLEIWKKYMVDTLKTCVRTVEVEDEHSGQFLIRFHRTIAPLALDWHIDTVTTFTVNAEGLRVSVTGSPQGRLPDTLPRIGLRLAVRDDFGEAAWYGRGPHPSYRDCYLGSVVGVYRDTVENMHVPYVVPQENGARLDTRWFALGDGVSVLRVDSEAPVSFSASPYSLEQLDSATHQNQLARDGGTHLHIDWAQHGLGSAGWGPEPLEKDRLRPEDFEINLMIRLWTQTQKEDWYER